jgi:hypothetical protein
MLINNIEFTFGADPEFFIQRDGRPVSAHGLIPGDKKNPYKVGWGAVQVDGMALEFNIDPAKGEAGFVRNLKAVMDTILKMVPDYQMYDQPVADFGFDYIQAQPQEAKELGCEPDFNAYTMDVNPRPNAEAPFRTASGHIHIGWTNGVDPHDAGHFEACATLAKMLDVYLGVPSLLWDEDDRRRELYGKAGSFRPKSYGMEYRTMSNRWLRPDKPYLSRFVFNNAVEAVKQCFKDPEYADKPIHGKTAREIVDSGDRQAAMSYLKYGAPYKKPKEYAEVA